MNEIVFKHVQDASDLCTHLLKCSKSSKTQMAPLYGCEINDKRFSCVSRVSSLRILIILALLQQ